VLKLVGSELHQKIAELTMEVAGPHAAATMDILDLGDPDLELGARAMAKHLSVRAATIYSGASETQRNIIAGRLLAGG